MNKNLFRIVLVSTLLSVTPITGISSIPVFADTADYTISNCWWDYDEEEGTTDAYWEKAETKTSYVVKLYKGDTLKGNKSTSSDHIDLGSLINKSGTGSYHFTVTATKGGSDTMITSEEMNVDSDFLKKIRSRIDKPKTTAKTTEYHTTTEESSNNNKTTATKVPAKWIPNPNGTWSYSDETGKKVKNKWVESDGYWYYIDEKGFMVTGWYTVKERYYYFSETEGAKPLGAMYANENTPDGYQVNDQGIWIVDGVEQIVANSKKNSSVPVQELTACSVTISEKSTNNGIREVTVNGGSNVEVSNVQFSIPFEQWNPASTVLITANVTAKSGYKFGSKTKYSTNKGTLEGSGGNSEERQFRIRYYPAVDLEMPTGFTINSNYELKWNKVEYARRYRVKVYYEGSLSETYYVLKPEIDLNDVMSDPEETKVAIAALGPEKTKKDDNSGNSKDNYRNSEEYVIDNIQEFVDDYSVEGSFKTSNGKTSYKDEDDKRVKGWNYIGGYWYYFDSKGYMYKSQWYQNQDGTWFYLDDDGRMVSGLNAIGGYYYCFNPDKDSDGFGAMLTGNYTLDGVTRWFNDGSDQSIPFGACRIE
jgi:glucan-binding YG repeat protein